MLSANTQRALFPLIKRALNLGRTSPTSLMQHGSLCQLSQGVHLIDQGTLVKRAREMKQYIWPDVKDDVTNLFAVKGQPNHWVLKTLLDEGFGFDCSSPTEILDALAVGTKPGQIMYTANATPVQHLEFALKSGAILNLDDGCYLDMLKTLPKTLSFRVNIASMRKGRGSGQSRLIGKAEEQKYGVPVEKIMGVFRRAKRRGVKTFGLHTMYASNNKSWKVHRDTFNILLRIVSWIYFKLGIRISFVNAGGGIGIDYKCPTDPSVKYRESDKPFDLPRYGSEVNKLLADFEKKHSWRPKFFLECARYVAAPAGIWVAPIIAVAEKYRRFVCMAACDGADLLRAGIYPAHHNVIVLDKNFQIPRDRKIILQSIVGPLCENIQAASQRLLPEIIRGDYVVFCDTGCHGIEMGMNYNGWTKSAQIMRLISGELQLISRAQTIADIRNLQMPFYGRKS
jgi:diaminopimelate decarboxylase